jgi:hypothetical protein
MNGTDMVSINKVILIGNLGLAMTENWKEKSTGESATWCRLVLFRRLAEITGRGDGLYICQRNRDPISLLSLQGTH